jgi:endonuclease/exonuclease/phosphatase family metal-dependent hydrolase
MEQRSKSHAAKASFTAATYNVHSWVNRSGRRTPLKTIEVVKSLDADVVALQEAVLDPPGDGALTAEDLARALGMQVIPGPTMLRSDARFGNLLLLKFPVLSERRWDLSVRKREPRGLLEVETKIHGRSVRILATHLGLRLRERARQMRRLVQIARQGENAPTVLLGDMNAWLECAPWYTELKKFFSDQAKERTFPAACPTLSFDRIMVGGGLAISAAEVAKSPQARNASDHLPVRARLILPAAACRPGTPT